MSYLTVQYNKHSRPKTDYPKYFIDYLIKTYKISKNSKVLELGCGRCDFMIEFKKRNLDIYGLDNEIYEDQYTKNLNVKKVNFEIDKLPFPDEHFDFIYHKSLIEHINDYDFFLSEQKRVLKKDGTIIFLTPHWPNQSKTFYDDPTHIKPYTEKGIKLLLNFYDFKDIKVYKFIQLPYIWDTKYFLTEVLYLFSFIFSYRIGRLITKITKINFFRFAFEFMIIASAKKK